MQGKKTLTKMIEIKQISQLFNVENKFVLLPVIKYITATQDAYTSNYGYMYTDIF